MRFLGFEFKKAKTFIKKKLASHYHKDVDGAYYRSVRLMMRGIDLDSASLSLLNQARNIAIASPSIYGYLQLMEGEIYGDRGFILDLDSPSENFNTLIEGLWKEWERSCDINGDFDFKDFERFVLLHYLRDGECFIYIQDTEDGLKLQIIPPENVDYGYHDGKKIKKGIEYDNAGKIIAYHINLGDRYRGSTTRVEAQNIIHFKKIFHKNQIRGISHLTPIIFRILQSDKYLESVIAQANVASRLSLVVTPKDEEEGAGGGMGDLDENQSDEVAPKTIDIEDGRIIAMNENYKIEPLNINHNPNVDTFMITIDRQIAKALGVSYASYTGNLSDVNFSSSQIGIKQERRGFKRLQNLIVRKIHTPIYERFIQNLLLRGAITPSQSKIALQKYLFRTQGWAPIDPIKEMNAQRVELEMGLKSMKEVLNDRGMELSEHAKNLKDGNDILGEEILRYRQIITPHPNPQSLLEDENEDEDENPKKGKE